MNILTSAARKAVLLAGASLLLGATPTFATTIFSVSTGIQPSNVGTITLTQKDSDTVNVFVDLLDGYGFLNTGGPHTPFAFNLSGSETGVSADFITPSNGVYANGTLSLSTANGDNTPFGTYLVSILSSAGNGSGNAYFGDLSFDLTRTGGLTEASFVANGDGYFFSADLTDGKNTGAQAWKDPGTPSVPDGGTTALLLGVGLVGLSFIARRRAA